MQRCSELRGATVEVVPALSVRRSCESTKWGMSVDDLVE